MPAGARIVTRPKLALSKDPSAELAAAALQATEDAGLELGAADFIVVAVPAGEADDNLTGRILTEAGHTIAVARTP